MVYMIMMFLFSIGLTLNVGLFYMNSHLCTVGYDMQYLISKEIMLRENNQTAKTLTCKDQFTDLWPISDCNMTMMIMKRRQQFTIGLNANKI